MPLLPLPVQQDLEAKAVLKKLAQAHRALAELKGIITSIPNQSILLEKVLPLKILSAHLMKYTKVIYSAMLDGIEKTAAASVTLITSIKELMQHYKQQIRNNHSKLYSQDLLNNLFKYPYTKIEFLQNDLQISRSTAIRYLDIVVKAGFLTKHKVGRDNFFLNAKLLGLLTGNS